MPEQKITGFIFVLILFFSGICLLAETNDVKKSFKKGIEYTNQGKYELAIQEFTRVITNDGDYANAYLTLAIVYINKKMDNEAVELLKKAIELDPDNKKTYFILAKLYEKLEDDTSAIVTWKKYLTLNPSDKYEEMAKKHLKRLKDKN